MPPPIAAGTIGSEASGAFWTSPALSLAGIGDLGMPRREEKQSYDTEAYSLCGDNGRVAHPHLRAAGGRLASRHALEQADRGRAAAWRTIRPAISADRRRCLRMEEPQ